MRDSPPAPPDWTLFPGSLPFDRVHGQPLPPRPLVVFTTACACSVRRHKVVAAARSQAFPKFACPYRNPSTQEETARAFSSWRALELNHSCEIAKLHSTKVAEIRSNWSSPLLGGQFVNAVHVRLLESIPIFLVVSPHRGQRSRKEAQPHDYGCTYDLGSVVEATKQNLGFG